MSAANVQYRVTRIVGEGAFGTVYEGERTGEGLSRRVAMKMLRAEHAGRAAIEGRLRDEARMLSLVHHRAIVRVEDLLFLEGAWCVVMEYVEGADLEHILRQGPIPTRAAIQIAQEVASALHAAYSQAGPDGRPLRLVHRDIKPANIRLTPHGEVKLLDFGIARADFVGREAATRAAGIGTIIYMAAERFRGEDTPAGDVYALGVTLFELLVGVPPGASAADVDRRPPGGELAGEWSRLAVVSQDLVALLCRMLADDSNVRPPARECARALGELRLRVGGELLEDWAERAQARLQTGSRVEEVARAEPAGPTLRVGQTIGSVVPYVQETSSPWRGWIALGVVGAVGLLLAATLVGAGAWWAYASRQGGTVGAVPAIVPPESPAAPPPVQAAAPTPVTRAPVPASAPDAREGVAVPSRTRPDMPGSSPTLSSARESSPRPVPPSDTGTVLVSGPGVTVRLHGALGDARPGAVAPGTWSADVTFEAGARVTLTGIEVAVGRTTTLQCDAAFATCAVSPPR